ncbi:MAG: fibronectin type III domain-containing protein [Burkholderiaceae bacterium]|nr:fibronectin type III domain-containing protein [Burkholderiaceae bacterium]
MTFTAPPTPAGATIAGYSVACYTGLTTQPPQQIKEGTDTSDGTTGLSHVITGLKNGVAYACSVTTTFSDNTTTVSPMSNVVIPGSALVAPTITKVGVVMVPYSTNANSGKMYATVNGPAKNAAGSPESGYTVSCHQKGGDPSVTAGTDTAANSTGSPSNHVVTGLTVGTTYNCSVKETFGDGTSQTFNSTEDVTPLSAPDAPALPQNALADTSGNGVGSAKISFPALSGVATGGTDPSKVYYGAVCKAMPGSPPAAFTNTPVDATGLQYGTPGTITHTITGLVNGATYQCQATAYANGMAGLVSNVSNTIGPINVGTYPGPASVGTTLAGGQVTLAITPPTNANAADPITGYTVTTNPSGATQICQVPPAPCVVSGLSNGAYTFSVATNNVNGAGTPSTSDTLNVGVFPAPTNVQPMYGGAGRVVVSFQAPPGASNPANPVSSYTITASPGGATQTCSSTQCSMSGLTHGTSYTFTIQANDSAGSSTPSAASASIKL